MPATQRTEAAGFLAAFTIFFAAAGGLAQHEGSCAAATATFGCVFGDAGLWVFRAQQLGGDFFFGGCVDGAGAEERPQPLAWHLASEPQPHTR